MTEAAMVVFDVKVSFSGVESLPVRDVSWEKSCTESTFAEF